jgi:starch phosphorylase
MKACGIDMRNLRQQEVEPGLGNGGLGRLAACFIDSLATMDVSCIAYGIRYEYGIFRQTFVDNRQVEKPDAWLSLGAPWEFPNPERRCRRLRGPRRGRTSARTAVSAAAGCRPGRPGNALQLHGPRLPQRRRQHPAPVARRGDRGLRPAIFNSGDYAEAVRAQTFAENISKVLYPEDSTPQGKELRLQQQYFFVACSLQGLPRAHDAQGLRPARPARADHLPAQRHPPGHRHPRADAPAPRRARPGVGRGVGDHQSSASPTPATPCCPRRSRSGRPIPHGRLLPRHMEIIYRINEEFLARCARPTRATNCACGGCRSSPTTRGGAHGPPGHGRGGQGQRRRRTALPVAARQGAADFSELWPEKFTNVTNGVTPRRFIRWPTPAVQAHHRHHRQRAGSPTSTGCEELEPYADDPASGPKFRAVKAPTRRGSTRPGLPFDGISLPEGTSRRHGQAPARIQAAVAQAPAHRLDSTRAHLRGSTRATVTPRTRRVRRQGGPGLLHGQGDHLPHQLGGRHQPTRASSGA